MIKIKKIGVGSMGKMFGALYAFMALIFGTIITLISLIAGFASSSSAGIMGVLFGVGAIIFLPIIYGLAGFVGGSIMALVYNFVASKVGGIEVETE